MTKYQEIPWLRVGAESVAIVGSILLAFAIEAWWQDRNELAIEQRSLSALLAEFEENDELLREARDGYERTYTAAVQLLAYFDQGTDDMDSSEFEQLVGRLISTQSTHLESGAYDALIASGELNLVRDESLRNRLAAWPSYVAEWSEEEGSVFSFVGEKLAPYISGSVRRRNISNSLPAFPDDQSLPPVPVGSNEVRLLRSLSASVEFDNLVYDAAESNWYAMRDGETLQSQLTMILDLIRQNINE